MEEGCACQYFAQCNTSRFLSTARIGEDSSRYQRAFLDSNPSFRRRERVRQRCRGRSLGRSHPPNCCSLSWSSLRQRNPFHRCLPAARTMWAAYICNARNGHVDAREMGMRATERACEAAARPIFRAIAANCQSGNVYKLLAGMRRYLWDIPRDSFHMNVDCMALTMVHEP